jgi:zinc protease
MDFSATLRPGVELADAERILFGVLEALSKEGPTAEELSRAKKQVRAQFGYGTETVTSQAYWLGSLECVASHGLFGQLLDRVNAVEAADVRRVAATYLTERRRTVGWLDPSEAAA